MARAWLSRGDGIALVYGTVMRHLSIALALAMNAFGEAGARVVVRRSSHPVRLARLHPPAFTDRLVRKFRLPVTGWRGPDPLPMLAPDGDLP